MAPDPNDTDELLRTAGLGDEGARTLLLARHRDRLRRMVAVRMDRRLAARVDPSDVVQEALAGAARGLSAYLRDRPLPFYPWLRQVAWRRLMGLYRHHVVARRRSVDREKPVEPSLADASAHVLAVACLAARGTSPSRALIREELLDRVHAALARALDPEDPMTLNNLAWARGSRQDSPPDDLARALDLVKAALARAPEQGDLWNTPGVIRYRLGDWKGAVEVFEKSVRLRDGGDPFDWLFLAMARHRLGDRDLARRWFDKAVAWPKESSTNDEELKRFRSEAETMLGPRADPKQAGPPG